MTDRAQPTSQSPTLLPGATLGVFGSGQLGRMFAMAAAELGYRVHVFSPEANSPAGQVADREVVATYDDLEAVAQFAQSVDVVTLEFENVSTAATDMAAQFAPVHPSSGVLHTTQDRLREKRFLEQAGIASTRFAEVTSAEQLAAAVSEIGTPAVLKTTAWGYDGKGQAKIPTPADAESAWQSLEREPVIYEAWVTFRCELSVLVARSCKGQIATYPPVMNDHVNHILDTSVCPMPQWGEVASRAEEIAKRVATELDAVGVLGVEFFLTSEGELLVNEIAPRPHNTGHLTIDACVCSQFEQQVRAICGLPLGSTELKRPAAMANLLGDLWQSGVPNWAAVLENPNLRLHLYGKAKSVPGRKMGHLTLLAESPQQALLEVRAARELLQCEPSN